MSLHSKLLNIRHTSMKTRKVGNWTMKIILTACLNAESWFLFKLSWLLKMKLSMKICTHIEEVKSWISQRLLHEFLGFVPTIILRMYANSLGFIHTASRGELSWAEPNLTELNQAEQVTTHIAGRANPNWKLCSWHFWSARMSNQVHVFSLMNNIWWRSLLFTRKKRFWVHNISSRRANFSKFHNLLDDLLKHEERF